MQVEGTGRLGAIFDRTECALASKISKTQSLKVRAAELHTTQGYQPMHASSTLTPFHRNFQVSLIPPLESSGFRQYFNLLIRSEMACLQQPMLPSSQMRHLKNFSVLVV
jgi:hypothetical protein